MVVDYEYGPAPNSPLGRMVRKSIPRVPGAAPTWVSFKWDGLGRLIEVETEGTDTPVKLVYEGHRVTISGGEIGATSAVDSGDLFRTEVERALINSRPIPVHD